MWEADPHALVSQSPEWLDMMLEMHRFQDCSRLYDFGGHRVMLLLARRAAIPHLAWSSGSWPPGWGFGGVLSEGGELSIDEARAIFQDLRTTRTLRSYLSPPI